MTDTELTKMLRSSANRVVNYAADRIETLTAERDGLLRCVTDNHVALCRAEKAEAERDEALNQLDSAIHSQIVLEKRTAAVMEDRKLILEERDRTFALMLARAEKAEAERDRIKDLNELLEEAQTEWSKYEGAWMTAEGKLEDAVQGLEKCQAELDEYSRQEYPLDHTVHERYRQRDYDANPARITLAALKGETP